MVETVLAKKYKISLKIRGYPMDNERESIRKCLLARFLNSDTDVAIEFIDCPRTPEAPTLTLTGTNSSRISGNISVIAAAFDDAKVRSPKFDALDIGI